MTSISEQIISTGTTNIAMTPEYLADNCSVKIELDNKTNCYTCSISWEELPEPLTYSLGSNIELKEQFELKIREQLSEEIKTRIPKIDKKSIDYIAGSAKVRYDREAEKFPINIPTTQEQKYQQEQQREEEQNQFLIEKAQNIWKSPNTINELVKLLSKYHEGDKQIMTFLLLIFIQGKIINLSEAFYLNIYAEAGGGKSHAFTTVQKILPTAFVKDTGLSDKYLTRAKGVIPDGSMIVFDDVQPSQTIYEIMKICSTRDRKPLYSVLEGVDNKPKEYELPQRLSFVQIRVDTTEGTTDAEQIKSRVIVVHTEKSDQHEKNVKDLIRRKAALNFKPEGISDLSKFGDYFWDEVPTHFIVDGEIAAHLGYKGDVTDRQVQQCIALMFCYTVYSQWDGIWENHETDGAGGVFLKSTKKDLLDAIYMMNRLYEGIGGDLTNKLNPTGCEIHKKVLEKYGNESHTWKSFKEFAEDLGFIGEAKYKAAFRAFYGREGKDRSRSTNILDTIPGYESNKITELSSPETSFDEKGNTTVVSSKRRSMSKSEITWDADFYHKNCPMLSGFYFSPNKFEHPDMLSKEELENLSNSQILERY